MPETLLSPSRILLYGRLVADLAIVQQNPGPPPFDTHPRGLGENEFLQKQVDELPNRPQPKLARVYAVSHEGHYYDLHRPTIFLVHGDGADAEPSKPAGGAARGPATADETGVAAQDYSFAEDMKVWSYDKGDFSIRMDVETGPFEQILLDAMLSGGRGFYSGAEARISGAEARISGAEARISGAEARMRGRRD